MKELEKKAKEEKREKDKVEKEKIGKAKKAHNFWGCKDGDEIHHTISMCFDVFSLNYVCDILAVVSLSTNLTFASCITMGVIDNTSSKH